MRNPFSNARSTVDARRGSFGKRKFTAVGLVMMVGVAVPFGTSRAASGQEFPIDIRKGVTPDTLREYQRQTQVKISYDPVLHVKTNRIHGSYTPEVALTKLLQGTGLRGTFLPTGEVTIEPMLPGTTQKQTIGPVRPLTTSPPPSAREPIPEVTVKTGTWVKDGAAVGADLTTFTAEDIDRAGATTVAQFIELQPQNFGGGPTQDTQHDSAEASANSVLGSGMNLRGLGARASLVLVNGRRIAPSGDDGSFTDIENIPIGAVDHVDVLPDGGSAIYGTDAVGGVVNFVLRDRLSGVEVHAEQGDETQGGQKYFRFSPMAGYDWETGHVFTEMEWYRRGALAANHRSFMNTDLTQRAGVNLGTASSSPPTLTFAQSDYAVPAGITVPVDLSSLQPGTENLSNPHAGADIVPYQELFSVDFALRQVLFEEIATSVDFLYTSRDAYEWQGGARGAIQIPADSPLVASPPANSGPVTLLYNFGDLLGDVRNVANVRTFNVATGAQIPLWKQWELLTSAADVWETEHQYSQNALNVSEATSALGSGALNPFIDGGIVDATPSPRLFPEFDSRSEIRSVTGLFRGKYGSVDDVPFQSALGIELRDQILRTSLSPPEAYLSLRRRLAALFGETTIPVLGKRDSDFGLRSLDLSLAGRLEYYSVFGRVATPRIGLTWSPLQHFEILASWGREIRAPNLGDLYEGNNAAFITPLPDPGSSTGYSNVLVASGRNAGLSPERAITRTVGFKLTLSDFPAAYLKAKYFNTNFGQVIQSTTFSQTLLTDPNFAGIVTRNPSAAARASICDDSNNHYPGSVTDCLTEPVAAIVDLRSLNLGTLHTDGIDLGGGVSFDVARDKFTADVGGTYILDYTTTAMPLAPRVNELNTIGEPIALRLNASLLWERGPLEFGLNINHTGSYRDIVSSPARSVSALTTLDVQVSLSFDDSGTVLRNTKITCSAKNVTDRSPPFVIDRSSATTYDPENADPYGRTVSIKVSTALN